MKIKYLYSLLLVLSTTLMSGCTELAPNYDQPEDGALLFTGSLYESSDLNTRSNPIVRNLTDSIYTGNFYIDMVTGTENGNESASHHCSTYRIPHLRMGTLTSYATYDSLVWQSKYNDHTFYAWTMPWLDQDPYMNNDRSVELSEERSYISFLPDAPMFNVIDEKTGENKNIYQESFEKFFGAKAGPLTYSDNGEYVNLRFQHLVSKIIINKIKYAYTDVDGKKQETSVDGVITFIGIPENGFFVRNGEKRPKVIGNTESKAVSYSFNSTHATTIYLCPDIDFSKVNFRIRSDVTDAGDFLGDFNALMFARDEADWWDSEHPDNRTLYAGEQLTINITLKQIGVPEMSLSISNWRSENVKEASDYPYNGIYDKSQWNDINNTFGTGTYEGKKEIEEEFCQRFGNPDNHELYLFTDIDGQSQRFRTGHDHVLNGMGHSITFSRYYPDVVSSENDKYVRISRVKDVFLIGPDGSTIYIDENYRIFIVHSDGSLEDTGNALDPELTEKENSYIINLATGAKSTYDRM